MASTLTNVSDICPSKDTVLISTYNSTIETLKDGIVISSTRLPAPLTKLTVFRDWIVGISYTSGVVVVLDGTLAVVDVMRGFEEPAFIASGPGCVVVGERHRVSVLVARGEKRASEEKRRGNGEEKRRGSDPASDPAGDPACDPHSDPDAPAHHPLTVLTTRDFTHTVTAVTVFEDKIAVAAEEALEIFSLADSTAGADSTDDPSNTDSPSRRISRTFPACINSVSLNTTKLAVGLINGTIHFEDLTSTDDSFTFNAHARQCGDERLLCPVSRVELVGGDVGDGRSDVAGDVAGDSRLTSLKPSLTSLTSLTSSGYDGRVIRWDVDTRRQTAVLFDCGGFVRKFVLADGLYCMIDGAVSRVVYTRDDS